MNKNDFLKKMNDPNVYLHITKDLNHKGQFKTRVPENFYFWYKCQHNNVQI